MTEHAGSGIQGSQHADPARKPECEPHARQDGLQYTIAVIIPCYNEELSIGRVVAAFQAALPSAVIYVFDNNSTDRTLAVAKAAGAMVRSEYLQGKGHVVRRAFADIEADVYVPVDGDDTYDAASAPAMIELLVASGLDMVTGKRVAQAGTAYRSGHRFGNRLLTGLVRVLFADRVSDMLSGYRVFSHRFVKSFPALSTGFETETELTVHALELHVPLGEIETPYRERMEGSASKLRTARDGVRILQMILILVKEERPFAFFSVCGTVLLLGGIGLGLPVVLEFLQTGLVPRLPTAVLALGLVLLSFLSFVCGLILDSVARGRKELKRLVYLSNAAIGK
jgi:glycosyltransferase involved in cell wall biosynthesis